ncbi:MAG TPA: ABC transporter permease subunit [Gammaproteobacteria bacterium]|jgi:spermidine/putrescine transport system permease protein|nr:ABC transporter permease subunit [Gammaproteobacteria bacterium]
MKVENKFKTFSLAATWAWMFFFALLPFALVLTASFLSHSDTQLLELPLTLNNYRNLNHGIYLRIFENSIIIASTSTLICLIIGYPFAYIITRLNGYLKSLCLMLIIIPFWTSSLIRSYALIAIIKGKGVLNTVLIALGIIHDPLPLLFTNTAVIIGLVYNLLPFMILPIMTNIERLDHRLVDAARDLGANRFTTFRRVIIPLSMPGIIAGCILVFLPAMTLFYISDILGGAKSILAGNLIQNKFLIAENWPMGAALSIVLTLMLIGMILIYLWASRGNKSGEWL